MKKWEIWEVKKLIPEFQKKYPGKNLKEWNNTILFDWEYNLLVHIGAINATGILQNYPILVVGDNYQDYEGDIKQITEKMEEINNDKRIKTKAKISYCPRSFSLWTTIKCEEANQFKDQEYAREINRPPVEAYGFLVKDMNF